MKLSITLLESNQVIQAHILEALKGHLNQALVRIAAPIGTKIKAAITDSLRREPEYFSLTQGELRLEFGIPDAGAVDTVINQLVNTLVVNTQPLAVTGRGLSGGISFTMMSSDTLGDVIYDPAAQVTDEARGYTLPWLSWLLLKGNTAIVKAYSVKLGSYPTSSRTGGAIMVESQSDWRVPTNFAGSSQSNWTTRAVDAAESSILEILQTSIGNIL